MSSIRRFVTEDDEKNTLVTLIFIRRHVLPFSEYTGSVQELNQDRVQRLVNLVFGILES